MENFIDFDLEAKAERLELVLEGTRLGMWDWNPQTNQVHFDKRWAEMLGYSYDEIEHHLDTWSSKVHPEDIDSCFADIKKHMDGEVEFYENIHRMKHKNGDWIYILDRGKIVSRDEAGNPVRFTGTHTDITPQKKAEQAAINALQARSLFFAGVSHEIRTPLQGIIGNIELLREKIKDGEANKLFTSIEDCSDLLLNVVNDILDFSKFETKGISLTFSDFSLSKLIENIVSVFSEQASENKSQLSYSIPEGLDFVEGDHQRLKQVLFNLVGNAVKFCPNGKIDIIIEEGVNEILFKVCDNGIGIAKEKIPLLFKPFNQVHENTSIGGTGLGLAISQSIIKKWGGKISVNSKINEFTEFSFNLKMKKLDSIRSLEPKVKGDVKFKNITALIVDDTEVNQILFSNHLEKLSIEHDIASDGAQAVMMAQNKCYDLILMDTHMLNMDGLQATRHIRSIEQNNSAFIVSLSANASREDQEECLKAGMNAVLTKPIKFAMIADLLTEHFPQKMMG